MKALAFRPMPFAGISFVLLPDFSCADTSYTLTGNNFTITAGPSFETSMSVQVMPHPSRESTATAFSAVLLGVLKR